MKFHLAISAILAYLTLCSLTQAAYISRMAINRIRVVPTSFRPGVSLQRHWSYPRLVPATHRAPYTLFRTPLNRYAGKHYSGSTRNTIPGGPWKTTARLPLLHTNTPSSYQLKFRRQDVSVPPRVQTDGGGIYTMPAPNLSLAERPIIVVETTEKTDRVKSFTTERPQSTYEVTEKYPDSPIHPKPPKIEYPIGFSRTSLTAPELQALVQNGASLQVASEYALPADLRQASIIPQQFTAQSLNDFPIHPDLLHAGADGLVMPPNNLYHPDPMAFLQKVQEQLLQRFQEQTRQEVAFQEQSQNMQTVQPEGQIQNEGQNVLQIFVPPQELITIQTPIHNEIQEGTQNILQSHLQTKPIQEHKTLQTPTDVHIQDQTQNEAHNLPQIFVPPQHENKLQTTQREAQELTESPLKVTEDFQHQTFTAAPNFDVQANNNSQMLIASQTQSQEQQKILVATQTESDKGLQVFPLDMEFVAKLKPASFVLSEKKNIQQRDTLEHTANPIYQETTINNVTDNQIAFLDPQNITVSEQVSTESLPITTTIHFAVESSTEDQKTTPLYFAQVGQSIGSIIANGFYSAINDVRAAAASAQAEKLTKSPNVKKENSTTLKSELKDYFVQKMENDKNKSVTELKPLHGIPFVKKADSVKVAYTVLRADDKQPKMTKNGAVYAGQIVEASISEDHDYNKRKASIISRRPLRLVAATGKEINNTGTSAPGKITAVVKAKIPPKSKLTFDDKTGEPVLRIYASYVDSPLQKEITVSKLANAKHVKDGLIRKQDISDMKSVTLSVDKTQGSDANQITPFGLKLRSRSDDYVAFSEEYEDY